VSPTDPWWKRLEIAVRRGSLRMLGSLAHRDNAMPPDAEFSRARVLFIRQDRIGDVLVSTPLFAALRSAYPSLIMDMVVSTNNAGALAGLPMIGKSWVYTKRAISTIRMIRDIRRRHYDYVVDLMDNPSVTSTILCMLSGARWTIGLDKENGFTYDVRVPLLSRRDVHIVERLAEILRVFRVDPADMPETIVYEPSVEHRKSAAESLRKLGVHAKVKVGVNISAGSESRFWGVDQYRAFVTTLASEHPDWVSVLLAKPSHAARARQIAEGIPSAVQCPMVKEFDAFAAMVEHLDFLLTPDTSIVHLASAFRIPCVVLYVQSNPSLRIWDPYHTPHQAVITASNDLASIRHDDVHKAWGRLKAEVGIPAVARSARGFLPP